MRFTEFGVFDISSFMQNIDASRGGASHDCAGVASWWFVLFDEFDLIGVKGVPSPPPNKVNGFEVVHSSLDECDRHKNWGTSQPSNAVHGDGFLCIIGSLLAECCVHQLEPIIQNFAGWGLPITERPMIDCDSRPFDTISRIGLFADSDKFLDIVLFHFSDVLRKVIIAWSVHDQEPHIFMLNEACSVWNSHFVVLKIKARE